MVYYTYLNETKHKPASSISISGLFYCLRLVYIENTTKQDLLHDGKSIFMPKGGKNYGKIKSNRRI